MNWYPKKKKKPERQKVRKICPVCSGKVKILDAKTRVVRNCVMCNGEGGYWD